jgi:hypothetical protein
MSDLSYPFSKCDEPPYYQVAMGTGEYVWVVLAGDYRWQANAKAKWRQIAVDLYCDLHSHMSRSECEREVLRWYRDLPDGK